VAEPGLAERFAAAGLDWIVPQWPAAPQAQGFVTTRQGGTSGTPYASMNAGGAHPARDRADDPEAIAANRARMARFTPAAPVWLEQVHGTSVVTIDAHNVEACLAVPPVADAAVTRATGVVLAVRAADCLPVLLAERGGAVVGVAHAGGRGMAAGVLEATVAAMAVAPASVVAWLGPAIGPDAFEVGPDVRRAFCDDDPGAANAFVATATGKWHADLYALARRRLARAGVHAVTGGGWCTYREAARFFSYRRERATGRMAAVVWREAAG
jgi:YfiH family protein